MNDHQELCEKCSQPTVCGHSWSLDGTRKLWRVCCLCTAELIQLLSRDQVSS